VAVASAGAYANRLHFTPDKHTSASSLAFLRLDALPGGSDTLESFLSKVTCERNLQE